MKIYKLEAKKPYIKALVYGKPGFGKTTFAATAMDSVDLSDVLFINIEGGLLTIADKKPLVVDIGRNEDGSPNGHVVQDLESVIWSVVGKKPGFENVKTVVLDSATELQTIDLEDVVNQTGKDIDSRAIQDYGKDSARLKRIFRMLKDIKCNVIFTAIVKTSVQENSGKVTEVAPALTAKVAESLMGYVDFVWYMYKDETGDRYILTEEQGPIRAKTRNKKFFDKIGKKVKNPTLPELYKTLCEVVNEPGYYRSGVWWS
jgi:phage nucleotide-binding protein